MADSDTSVVNNNNLLMVYFQRRLIKTLHENVAFYQLCEKYPLPLGAGTQMTFNGWRKISAASTTLAEASSNAAVALSSRKVNVTVNSYGRSVKLTELLELTSILPPVEGAMRELEHSARLTLDNVVQLAVFKNVIAQVGQNVDTKAKILSAWMSATASSFCSNTGTNANTQFGFPVVLAVTGTVLSGVSKTAPSISARLGPISIRKAVVRLRRLACEPFADGRYVGIAHPNALATMFGNSDWKQWQFNYAGGPQQTMYKNESALVHNVRLIDSPNAPRYAVAAHSVNLTFICGEGALGITELNGGIEMIIKRPGPQTTSEPFNLNSYVSYKLRSVAAVLNPSCGVIVLTHELF